MYNLAAMHFILLGNYENVFVGEVKILHFYEHSNDVIYVHIIHFFPVLTKSFTGDDLLNKYSK